MKIICKLELDRVFGGELNHSVTVKDPVWVLYPMELTAPLVQQPQGQQTPCLVGEALAALPNSDQSKRASEKMSNQPWTPRSALPSYLEQRTSAIWGAWNIGLVPCSCMHEALRCQIMTHTSDVVVEGFFHLARLQRT